MTGRTFQYGYLKMWRHTDGIQPSGAWPVRFWWFGEGVQQELEEPSGDVLVLLDQLGSKGWELVGPPEVMSFVRLVEFKNPTGGSWRNNAADWLSRGFWMRREVDTS